MYNVNHKKVFLWYIGHIGRFQLQRHRVQIQPEHLISANCGGKRKRGNQSDQMLEYHNAQFSHNVAVAVFTLKWCFSKEPPKLPRNWVTLKENLMSRPFQSGHNVGNGPFLDVLKLFFFQPGEQLLISSMVEITSPFNSPTNLMLHRNFLTSSTVVSLPQ